MIYLWCRIFRVERRWLCLRPYWLRLVLFFILFLILNLCPPVILLFFDIVNNLSDTVLKSLLLNFLP